jgi:hypothetical protein
LGLSKRLHDLDAYVFERGPTLQVGERWQDWWDGLDRFERRTVFDAARGQDQPRDAEEALAWAAVLRARARTFRDRTPMVRRVTIGFLIVVAVVVTLANPSLQNLAINVSLAVAIGWTSTLGRNRAADDLDARADVLESRAGL